MNIDYFYAIFIINNIKKKEKIMFKFFSYKNDVFRSTVNPWKNQYNVVSQSANATNDSSVASIVEEMRKMPKEIYIKNTSIPNVFSFNFSRDVFFKGKWSELSKIARGLFINTTTNEIVARGYDKFFNFEEGQFNTLSWLEENLKFPVYAYEKYNGFLGMLGYDSMTDSLAFCSKSSTSSDFSTWFKEIFNEYWNGNIEDLKRFIKNENLCLIFEVIDPKNDPHIIKYYKRKIVLIGVVKRTVKFTPLSYEEQSAIAANFNFEIKQRIAEFNDFQTLKDFILAETKSNNEHEGYVFEDNAAYMFKLKNHFYKFWKNLRSVKDRIAKGYNIPLGWCQDALATEFIGWCYKQDRSFLSENSIIDLREKFLKDH